MPLFLEEHVRFYKRLNAEDRKHFEEEVYHFLDAVKITGVKTAIGEEDQLLVAAAGVIPIFHFTNWFYPNLEEVIIYPTGFDENFNLGDEHRIQGMVGNRFMNGKMLLSKRALHGGFGNKTDRNNTGIHEFIHLVDMEDGAVDGIPSNLLGDENVLPWVDLMYRKIAEIKTGESDIKPYGATNEAEFFSVVGEYFFERPELLQRKHPELYMILEQVFVRKVD